MISPIGTAAPQINHTLICDTRVTIAKIGRIVVLGLIRLFGHGTFVPLKRECIKNVNIDWTLVL